MIAALARLLVILVAAETVAATLALPFPGAVLGLAVVFAHFAAVGAEDAELGQIFDAAAPHATLLFVPAAVGVISNVNAILSFWVTFAAVVAVGTAVTLIAVGLAAEAILRLQSERRSS